MNEEMLSKAAAFMASVNNCVLALLDDDGYPTAATITPSKTEGIQTVFIGNSVDSNWAKRAMKCNRASICYSSDSPECNITLVGVIEVVKNDLSLKKELWMDWMTAYFSGPEDPRFCIMRFETRRFSIFMDGTQSRGVV